MRDIGTGNMAVMRIPFGPKSIKYSPDRYEVIMTGKALVLKRNEILT
jgi:hypothetical protein